VSVKTSVDPGRGRGARERRHTTSTLNEEEQLGKAYDARLLRRLWTYVAPYRWQVALTLVLVFPMFFLELAPAWIVKTGIDRVMAPEHAASAQHRIALFESVLDAPAGIDALVWLGILYLAALVLEAGASFAHMVVMSTTGQAAMRDLRRAIFAHFQALHMGYFDTHPVGRLVTRASNDVENIAEMFSSGIIAVVTDVIKMLGFAVALFLVAPRLALMTFSVVPVVAGAAFLFRLRIRAAFRRVRTLIGQINANLQETLTGMKVVQLFTREDRNFRDFARVNAAHRNAWFESIRYDAALFAIVELAGGVTVAITIAAGSGYVEAGVLFVFFDWMKRFFMPVRDLSAKFSVMQSAMASSERIFQLLDTEPAIRDPDLGVVLPPRPRGEAAVGGIDFSHVWFAYHGEDWVLRDISFHVDPGERVAFVGPTGAGKSSIIKLLARLYEAQAGSIRLDGVELAAMPQQQLRRRVAVVPQDVFLFSGSVADNIGLGRPGVDTERIHEAARMVKADRFIERFVRGYGTDLRERGANLSGGQRQLLSFARTLAGDFDVILLDEATSSIDLETEALVQQGIHQLMAGKTAIVIAHRLSTIEDVDRIYVLDQGKIVETGQHHVLLEQKGVYYRLHELQEVGNERGRFEASSRRG